MKIDDIIIGATYNNIKVVGERYLVGKTSYFECECLKCGKKWDVAAKHIGKIKSCAECCKKSRIIDLTNMKFGRLSPIKYVGRTNGRTLWECICDCGNHTIVGYSNLVSGITKSCGCYDLECKLKRNRGRRKSATSEKFNGYNLISDHPLYNIWSSMITRCYNVNRKHFDNYGGRGIEVCDRWRGENGFENFVNDMGERPSPNHSIDRIDVNGNYNPENCRWATPKEQCNNRRVTRYIVLNGEKIALSDFCSKYGLNYWSLYNKLRRGFDINEVVLNLGICDYRRTGVVKAPKNFNIEICIELPTGKQNK